MFRNNEKSSLDYNYADIRHHMGTSNLVFQLLGALTYSFANAVSRVPAVQWLGLGKGFIFHTVHSVLYFLLKIKY